MATPRFIAQSSSPLLVALTALAFAPACVVYEKQTTVQLRDPAAVRLTMDTPEGARTFLDEGRAAQAVPIASGTFATGPGARGRYRVDAMREEDASVVLRVDARVALPHGEEHVEVTPDGKIEQAGATVNEVLPVAARSAPDLRLPRCVSLSTTTGSEGDFLGYDVNVDPSCGPYTIALQRFRLETPWSNVVEARSTEEPQRWLSVLVMSIATASFLVPGALLVHFADGDSTVKALGWTFVAIGGALDLGFLPNLVAPSSTTVLTRGAGLPP